MKLIRQVKPDFIDFRGSILRPLNDLLGEKIRSVSIIVSHTAMIRGNHYHKKEAHWMYVLDGRMDYFEKSVLKPKSPIKKVSLKKGDIIFTSPFFIHTVKFHTPATVIYLSTAYRKKKGDMGDTFKCVIL